MTTEYSSLESRIKNNCMVANAALRHRFGIKSSYRNAGPAHRQLKSLFGVAIKHSGLLPDQNTPDLVTFKIGEDTQNYIVDIPPFERNF